MSSKKSVSLSERQIEALRELINIGVGHGAEVLNTMLQSHIALNVPEIQLTDINELERVLYPDSTSQLSAVEMKYRGNFTGSVELIFPTEDASKMVSLLIQDELPPGEMDELRSATLQEIGNVLLNAVMGTISNIFSFSLKYSLPTYLEGDVGTLISQVEYEPGSVIICAKTRFTVADIQVEGTLVLFFSLTYFDDLLSKIETYSGFTDR
ncbi:MAG TPA: chemotaxis protein CheC [Sediminispirochaeta sp.]|nr:chemotaxis protein CheC [Sediminispirochaeta sp.]